MEHAKSPTIHDVAKLAGVSLSTVSRVLNDYDSVNPQTRENVEAAIRESGYEKTKSESAKGNGAAKTIGLIIPDILNPFFPLLIKGVEQVSRIHGYSLMLCDSENDPALEQQHLDMLSQRGVAGMLLIPASSKTPHAQKLIKQGKPFVFLDRFVVIEGASYVTSDNAEGAYQAVKYLLKLGHQRIVLLTGPRDLSTEQARMQGYQQAVAEEGIASRKELIITGNYSLDEAYQETSKLIQKQIEFTAIFATDDIMAFGAKRALEEHGLEIPADVSLVGYDDIRFSSIIALTTVSQPTYEMGRNAVVLLLDLINARITTPQHIVLRPSMIIRGSCQRR